MDFLSKILRNPIDLTLSCFVFSEANLVAGLHSNYLEIKVVVGVLMHCLGVRVKTLTEREWK